MSSDGRRQTGTQPAGGATWKKQGGLGGLCWPCLPIPGAGRSWAKGPSLGNPAEEELPSITSLLQTGSVEPGQAELRRAGGSLGENRALRSVLIGSDS